MTVSELIKQLMQCYSNATVLIKADNHDIKVLKVEDCGGFVDLIPDESLYTDGDRKTYIDGTKTDDAYTEYPLDLMRWMASKGGVFEFNYDGDKDEHFYVWRKSQYSKFVESDTIDNLYEQLEQEFGD